VILRIKAKPNAKSNTIKKADDGSYEVRLAAPPIEGKANQILIEFLSDILKIPKSKIKLLKGNTSRIKTVELPDDPDITNILNTL
jgi:uncharacterized protein (TIGR00251 family)